ncbi:MAG: phosphoglycerate kinase [Patescibacteria group bacterium]|jgi:phosphoglycerate kinase
MKLRKLTADLVRGKRVLHRVCLDVKFDKKNGQRIVKDDKRLREILPTIRFLRKANAKVIILTYIGRPKGKRVPELSADPVAARLGELLHIRVKKVDDCIGPAVQKAIAAMKPRDVLMLENVRFHAEEGEGTKGKTDGSDTFGKKLAALADVIVMDAFGQMHRAVPSILHIQKYMRKRAAGLLLEKEVKELDRALNSPYHPFTVIIGGAKVETKLPVMTALMKHADDMLVGGVLANTLLKAKGIQTGRSLVDDDTMFMLKKFNLTDKRLHLPVDVMVEDAAGKRHKRAVGAVQPRERILDIGPETIVLFHDILKKAKMVLWNGPLGYFEDPTYAIGTNEVGRILGKVSAYTIIGGGETITAVRNARAEKHIDFISTGGGAMLEFLTGKTLPGIKPLLV